MRAATAVMVEEFLTRGALVQSAATRIDRDGGEPFQEGSGIIGPDCHEYEQMKAIFGSRGRLCFTCDGFLHLRM